MKLLSTFLIIVLLLSCMTFAQDKMNPLEGTTWELTSGKWVREDTTFIFPTSPYHQEILIYGNTHWAYVSQDTSLEHDNAILGTYSVDGDNVTQIYKMAPGYKDIGSTLIYKFQIKRDQLILKTEDYYWAGYKWKGFDHVWSRTTKAQEKKNPLAGTTWEGISLEVKGDTTFTFPNSPYDRSVLLYGKRHFAIVQQDTSRESSHFVIGTYNYNGDTISTTIMMYPNYEDIGFSHSFKVQIEDDKLVITTENLHYYGRDFKSYREEWKRID